MTKNNSPEHDEAENLEASTYEEFDQEIEILQDCE